MNAGKRHFGQWSSIGQWNLVNADTAKRTCHSVRIIRVFIRLVTPVSYFYFFFFQLFPPQTEASLCPKEGGEKEKKSACLLYFDYSAGASVEKRLFWGERR